MPSGSSIECWRFQVAILDQGLNPPESIAFYPECLLVADTISIGLFLEIRMKMISRILWPMAMMARLCPCLMTSSL